MVLHEVKPGWTITKEWEGYTIEADVAFAEVDPDEYLGIFFSGGRAPEYIRDDEDLVRITRHFFEAGKPICQRLPRRRDSRLRRLRPGPPHGDGAPSASSIWKCAAASTSTSRAWSTATWSAAGRITTTGTTSASGSIC